MLVRSKVTRYMYIYSEQNLTWPGINPVTLDLTNITRLWHCTIVKRKYMFVYIYSGALIFHHNLQINSLQILQCNFLDFFLILSLIVEVYLWWKLQASLIFLSGRTCAIGGWLNTFLPHCIYIYIHIHIYIYIYIHIHIHTHIYIYIYIYIHTHTPTHCYQIPHSKNAGLKKYNPTLGKILTNPAIGLLHRRLG